MYEGFFFVFISLFFCRILISVKMRISLILFVLILISALQIHCGNSRVVRENSNLVSVGEEENEFDGLDPIRTTVSCEPIYGFLPCTSLLWGQLFMVVVYEFLLFAGQNYVAKGSELFFTLFGTGIFGASLFQVLGTIPQVVLVLVSGITASSSSVQTLTAMGMAMLTGSAILSLTIVWGSVVIFGSQDLSSSSNSETRKPFSFNGYGVTTDEVTKSTARFMLVSLIPFLILQLAKAITSWSGQRIVVLISLVITVIFVVLSSTYQVFRPWMQKRRLEYLLHRYIKDGILHSLLASGDRFDPSYARELFNKLDLNRNSVVSATEVRALVLGIHLEGQGSHIEDYVDRVMQHFDTSADSNINEEEFINGISQWVNDTNLTTNGRVEKPNSSNSQAATSEEQKSLISSKQGRKVSEKAWFNYTKAAFLVALGTGITLFLANPLMQTLQEFSESANIHAFLVSYVLLPVALNYRLLLNGVASARKKTETAISLTFSEIYSGVYMNNLMSLMTFLAIVYIRDVSWDVSAEVLVVVVICVLTSFLTSFCTTFPVWTSFIAFTLYPLSLLLLYILTYILGWP